MIAFLAEFSILVAVPIVWIFFVRYILVLFGIHPSQTGTGPGLVYRIFKPLDLSKHWYVFVNGVVILGWSIFLGVTISQYIARKYFSPTGLQLDIFRVFFEAIFWSLMGVWAGLSSWKKLQESSPRGSAQPHMG